MQIEIKDKRKKQHKLKRVAAYCRVSDDNDRLLNSLDAQREHYETLIKNTPGWALAGIYADEAITGTTQERPEFQRLLSDCQSGLIDIILCKSISRFSRNTVDFLKICRKLKKLNVDVRFEKENISVDSKDGELIISMLASFSQEESRSISENIKWGIRKGFEEGRFTHYHIYGYEYDGNEYRIVPKEAETIKRIYSDFLSGKTTYEIETAFSDEGIKSPKGSHFSIAAILRILQNPSYTGSTVLQREYIENHISHKRMKNNGELAKYVVSGSHPRLISQEDFDLVQTELKTRQRRKMKSWHTGIIICGECESTFRWQHGKGKLGYLCCRGKEKHICTVANVTVEKLLKIVSDIVGTAVGKDNFSDTVEQIKVYKDIYTIKLKNGDEKIWAR